MIVLHLPPAQPTMPHPCAGAPPGPWCSGQVIKVAACVRGQRLTVRAPLAPRERLVSLTVARARGLEGVYLAGRGSRLTVALGHPHARFRITFAERLVIRHHRESFSFTNVYRAC
jgi:hypothetical protein